MSAVPAAGAVERRPPRVADAVGRVFDAAESIAAGHVGLAKLEMEMLLERTAEAGALLLGGALCLLFAWLAILAVCFRALVEAVGPGAALGVLAAANAILGGALLALGVRRARPGSVP